MPGFFEKILTFIELIYNKLPAIKQLTDFIKKVGKKGLAILFILFILIVACKIPFFKSILSESELEPYMDFLYESGNTLLFIIFVVLIAINFYASWRNAKHSVNAADATEMFIRDLHSNYIHDMRDRIRELDENIVALSNPSRSTRVYAREQMLKSLSDNIQDYVDFIAEHLSKYRGTTISACFKMVGLTKLDSKIAVTVARSSNTKKKRAKIDEQITIDENDDFKFLYDGKNNFFASDNLAEEYSLKRYKVQEDVSIWKNKYTSTLVVPVRYYSKHSKHNQINLDLDILGFLCIDSTEKMSEWIEEDSYELNFLAIFADELYIYMKKFKDIYSINLENDL